jgi:thiamine-phosphate pyrophosphorylase
MIIILISPEKERKELEFLPSLFESGLQYFHIRKPSFDENQLKHYIRSIPEKFHKYIVIHSFHHLIKEFTLKGIHFPEHIRKNTTSFPGDVHTSSSFHTVEELKNCNTRFDYVFLSPIFNSISKAGYSSDFELPIIKKELQMIDQKVVALGGIDEVNLKEVKQTGFAGIALLGAIWQDDDPIRKFSRLRNIVYS